MKFSPSRTRLGRSLSLLKLEGADGMPAACQMGTESARGERFAATVRRWAVMGCNTVEAA